MKSLVVRTGLSVLILTFAIPSVPLFAQDTTAKTEEEKKLTQRVTEEMVVTARKREETVQEVPMSVAAPTESELRDRGAETIEDVAANVAGFTVQNLGPGQSQVAMRGISSGQIARDQPGVKEQVGVYLDESVISLSLFTPDIDLFDLSRVEILRGPQGTLFGSGSEAGTVRYITNRPKLGVQELVGDFSANRVGASGDAGASAKVALNTPLGAKAALRVVGYYTQYGGYIDAVQPDFSVNENVNAGDRAGVRLTLRYEPNERFNITPRLLFQRVGMNGWNRVDAFNILGNRFTTTRPAARLGAHRQFTQIGEPFTDEFLLGDVTMSFGIGRNNTLTSITSYTDRDVLVVRDAGALTASITGGSIGLPANVYMLNSPLHDATTAKIFTQEARVSGTMGRVEWLVGGFYSSAKRDYSQDLRVTGFQAATGVQTRGFRAPVDSLFWSDLHYDLRQSALFGEATFTLNDRVELTGGLRAYNFKEDRDQVFDGLFVVDNPGRDQPVSQPGSTDASGIVPRFTANFKLNDMSRFYAQVAKGFRLGGINDPLNRPLCTPADLVTFGGFDTWKDETLWNYEVGSKNRVMGGRGTVNVAAFYSDISNLQATVTAGSCSSRIVFNVPKARSTGAEVEFEFAPTDAFDIAISATRTDSKLKSTMTSTDTTGKVTVVSGIRSGARMPSVPQNQAAAAATYRWVAGSWGTYLTGAYQHVGSRYTQVGDDVIGPEYAGWFTAPNTLNINSFAPNTIGGPLTQNTFVFEPKLQAYDLFNLRFGVLLGRWDTALFVNNVTDETAYLALDRERGFRARVGYLTNQPRTIGISTRVTF